MEVASKEHNYNDVVIITNSHHIIVNILKSGSTRMRQDRTQRPDFQLRAIQPGNFLPAISILAALSLAGTVRNLWVGVYYGEAYECALHRRCRDQLASHTLGKAGPSFPPLLPPDSCPRMRSNERYLFGIHHYKDVLLALVCPSTR